MNGQSIAMLAAVEQPHEDVAARVGALFDLHHQRVYTMARRLSRSADDARDLVQETFLRAARSPGTIPSGSSREEAWLVRVLINICRDRWRQSAVRSRARVSGHVAAESAVDPEPSLGKPMTKTTPTTHDAIDWRAWLEEEDSRDSQLDPAAALAIRRAVVAAARETPSPAMWPRPLAVALMVIVMIGAGIGIGQRFEAPQLAAPRVVKEGTAAPGGQRQLQFATPGGTRIIWVFNSDLDLKAVMP
jgi:RNA polymerase sigma factor (sigma-70 family)